MKTKLPQHPIMVSINGKFEIGKFPITQAEYQHVMGVNPSYFTGDLDRPVETVSLTDILTFIKKLNEMTDSNFRLPTEREWLEAACLDDIRDCEIYNYAWLWCNSGKTTHQVGMKKANKDGLHDMLGNVWEEVTNSAVGRALRGGSWSSAPQDVRASYRYFIEPAVRNYSNGFRLARSVQK